ncbi:MAG: NADH-quinone oxidoreductase subunit NuoH [Bacillaceae bacterium]
MMDELLRSAPSWMNFLIFFILGAILLVVILGYVSFAILSERKVMGFMQGRIGPNHLGGRWGLLQSVADILKLLIKEDTVPKAADRMLFLWAPVIAFAPSFIVLALLPFSENLKFADVGVGFLYYVAISGISTIGILTAGWASNNKYALLGGMRAAAQMISYELPLVLSGVGIVLLAGSLNLNDIVLAQKDVWFIFAQPVAFVIFLIAGVAELNRTPFDLPEAESELVAGYHTEYSGFRFAFFMLSEYVYLFAMSALVAILFLGGWQPVFYMTFIPGVVWFSLKFAVMLFFFLWIRYTFPRMRADHLMEFGWKVLMPIAIANIFLTVFIKALFF